MFPSRKSICAESGRCGASVTDAVAAANAAGFQAVTRLGGVGEVDLW